MHKIKVCLPLWNMKCKEGEFRVSLVEQFDFLAMCSNYFDDNLKY